MLEQHQTEALAERGPSEQAGRRALGISCFVILMLGFGWGAICSGLIVTSEFMLRPGTALLGVVAATALSLPYLAIILWLDRNEPEPPWLMATAFCWGAFGATALSIVGNGVLGGVLMLFLGEGALADQATASLVAPLVEELSKAVALVAIYVLFRHHFDNVLDGILYGALIGLGFAVFENFMYYMKPDDLVDTFMLIWLRGVVSAPGTHICFTAITGAAVGLFRVRRVGVGRWFIVLGGIGLAMFAHFCWNTLVGLFGSGNALVDLTLGIPLAVLFLQVPFLLMVLVTASLALRHEAKIIQTFLASEMPPVVHSEELRLLVPARRRTLRGLQLMWEGRFLAAWHLRRRNRLLVQLAFEKWHMNREAALGDEVAQDHARSVQLLRGRLSELPGPPT